MAKKRKGNRTRKGGVSSKARKRYGGGKGLRKGSFPVFDGRSARSALKLRGHAKSKKAVVRKVRNYARRTKNKSLLAAANKAAKRDRKRK